MERVRSGVADGVVDIADRAAEFGSEAVGYRLHLAHVAVGNGEQAQAVLVALGVRHTVQLVLHAVIQAVGVDHARHAQFGVRMSADARLKQNEIVGIAGGERQVLDLHRVDGPARIDARGLDHRRAARHFHGGGDGSHGERGVEHRFGSGIQNHSGPPLLLETFFLDDHGVRADGQVGDHKVSLLVGYRIPGKVRGDVFHGNTGSGNGGAGRVGHTSANAAVNCLGLGEKLGGNRQQRNRQQNSMSQSHTYSFRHLGNPRGQSCAEPGLRGRGRPIAGNFCKVH